MEAFDDRLGKLSADRRELLDLWLAGDETVDAARYAPPETATERALAQIWQDVLDVERVGVDDDYFALGGDSILAIVVVTKAQDAGIPLSTHDLFEAPTVRELAQRAHPAEQGGGGAAGPGRHPAPPGHGHLPASLPGTLPLTPMQAGMLFHALSDTTAYVVQASCRLDGDVNVAELARAWQIVVDRRPELRVFFDLSGDEPRQAVAPTVAVPVETADWRQHAEPTEASRIGRYLAEDRRRGIDPTAAPLLRVGLFRVSQTAYQCVFTHHHLLLDGWSQQLVLAELLEVYDELPQGSPRPPAARMPFAAYIDWLGRQDLAAAEEFWRGKLHGFTPAPIGEPAAGARSRSLTRGADPAVAAGSGLNNDDVEPPGTERHRGPYELLTTELPERVCAALADLSRRHRLTLSAIVQGGWALLLGRLGNTDDVAFGVTVSGRPAGLTGVTEALGMFINTVAARIRIRPGDEPLAWLHSIQRMQAELLRYQYTPLTLVERCGGLTPPARLFGSIVVLENFPVSIGDTHTTRRLRISDATAVVEEGYPLVLEVRPGTTVRLRLRHDRELVGAETAGALLAALEEYLSIVAARPPADVTDLSARLGAVMTRQAAIRRGHGRAAMAAHLRAARRQPAGGADAREEQ